MAHRIVDFSDGRQIIVVGDDKGRVLLKIESFKGSLGAILNKQQAQDVIDALTICSAEAKEG